jgi:Fic family protein
VRVKGDWESWIRFFLIGVDETAAQAVATAQSLVALFERDRRRIGALGKISGSALRVHHVLQQKPIASPIELAEQTGLSMPTVNAALKALSSNGLTTEITGQKRGRLYSYQEYLQVLNEGT